MTDPRLPRDGPGPNDPQSPQGSRDPSEPNVPSDALDIAAYADGSLTGEARTAFEARLAADAGLREQVELERRVAASLRRLFETPEPSVIELSAVELPAAPAASGQDTAALGGHAELENRIDAALRGAFATPDFAPSAALPGNRAGSGIGHFLSRHKRWAAIAASLLLAVVVVATAIMAGKSGPPECPDEPYLELSRLYVKALEPGFKPDRPWNSPDDFVDMLNSRFGVKIGMNTPPGSVQILGWSDAAAKPEDGHAAGGAGPDTSKADGKVKLNGLSPETVTLFARTSAGPVVLVIDRLSADAALPLAQGSRLLKHRREVAGLVIYEISMSDRAVLVDRFEPR